MVLMPGLWPELSGSCGHRKPGHFWSGSLSPQLLHKDVLPLQLWWADYNGADAWFVA